MYTDVGWCHVHTYTCSKPYGFMYKYCNELRDILTGGGIVFMVYFCSIYLSILKTVTSMYLYNDLK